MISVVDQEVAVFNNTAFANIAFPNPDASLEEVQEAATVAGIASKIESLPNGYFTPLGERGVTLSGGERQRLELARAFLDSGSLLIFDEATSALDPVIEKEILSSIREILKNRTGITIAHRLSTIFHSDKIIVLDKGKVVEQGTHDELMNLNGAYYSLVLPQTQA
jgi:ATP-binding cassette subfamily B protein